MSVPDLNPTRRGALCALIAAVAAILLPGAPYPVANHGAPRLGGRVRKLFGFPHSAPLPEAFRMWRDLSDEEIASAIVTGAARLPHSVHRLSDEELRRQLRSNITSDYREGRLEYIGSWCVARTEAYAIELLQRGSEHLHEPPGTSAARIS